MHVPRAAGSGRRTSRGRLALTGTAVGAAALALTVTPGASQAAPALTGKAGELTSSHAAATRSTKDIDVRQQGASSAVLSQRAARQVAHPRAGLRSLRTQLGIQGVVSLDPLTGTPRSLSKLDGFLTGPSRQSPSSVALGFVRTHAGALGLDGADLATLRLRKTYTDISGTRHLSYVQYSGSVPVFGNGLKANVAKDGRLISLQGSPVHGLASVGTSPGLSATAARSRAIRNVSEKVTSTRTSAVRGAARLTTFGDGDRASLVAFQTVDGARLAWQTLTTPGQGQMFLHVVDASTGQVLVRRNLVQSDRASVWEYWPTKGNGGEQRRVDLPQSWLPNGSPRLAGNNAHVWSDVNDDNIAQSSEEVTPGKYTFRFPFRTFNPAIGRPCTPGYQCSWNNQVADSWKVNRKQNAVQVFYYVNKMHDHLRAAPIGFTRAAGNFEAVGDDAVQTQPDDGADTGDGFPDSSHVDNANMSTPQDGIAPTMQMYLFNDPAAGGLDPFLQSNGGDEADVVYHEYTHGLSNRLVVDPSGLSTLGGVQAGAMGEAWSDWYAMDFLTDAGYQGDTSARGEVRVGQYVGKNKDLIRSQPMDCPVGARTSRCHGTPEAGHGGYTYGDYSKIAGGPEVHGDGEIWGETLWDLRAALGSKLTESLVTRAMELSPANPSFLDERNSILQADTVVNRGRARATIWKVFAHRGMGYLAGAVNGDDAAPVEDFNLPPVAGTPTGTLTGTVSDDATGDPVQGTVVGFGGHASGFPGDYAATTARDGTYSISGIFAGTYPAVSAGGNGYDRKVAAISVNSGTQNRDWALRFDWASLAGGATVTDDNDHTGAPFGCGPAQLFDQSQAQGWSAERHAVGGTVTPVFVVLKLPQAVDVSEIAVDPSGTCGDSGSASTGPYSIETSTDGTTWTTASSGTFTPADRGRFNSPTLAGGSTDAVHYVRYTMKDSQVLQVGSCPGAFSGCDFIDSSELEVYGTPSTP
ncbi:MAG: M36 family metallopeptidase [Nocardioidaceae bacterium]